MIAKRPFLIIPLFVTFAAGCSITSVAAEFSQESSKPKPPAATLQSAITLRKAGKFEAALEVLKKLDGGKPPKADDKSNQADARRQIPLERALIYQQRSKTATSSEKELADIKLALNALDKFLKTPSTFPRHWEGQALRGRILLRRVTLRATWAKTANSEKQAAVHRKRGLKDIPPARATLKKVRDHYQAKLKTFPRFIPPENKALRKERIQVEVDSMRAMIDLAKVTYEESQLVVGAEKDRNELLKKAAGQFETIHQTYRTQIAGLYAQMWQGKCLEEMGQIGKALGIFNQLLEHPSRNRFYVTVMRPQALSFKLICLNHKSRKDYLLVIAAAGKWLKEHKPLHNTLSGHRIRWELAVAHDGASKSAGLKADEVKRHRQAAIDSANALIRGKSQFRTPALALIKRLGGKISLKPKSFEDALELAKLKYADLRKAVVRVRNAKKSKKSDDEIVKLETAKQNLTNSTAKLLRSALNAATPKTDPGKLNLARYLLGYVEHVRGRYPEAQKLAMQAARASLKSNPQTSQQAAYVAFAAGIAQFNKAEAKDRAKIVESLGGIVKFFEKNWPDSKYTKSVRGIMKQMKERLR